MSMRLVMTALLLGATPASAADLPQDVAGFEAQRDRCDHFRGEESDDPARRAAIARAQSLNCRGTDAELARLLHRYAGNPAIRQRLSRHDPAIESPAPRRR